MSEIDDAGAAVAYFRRELPDWTSWEIRSRQRMTAFVAEVARLADNDEGQERCTGHGPTPLDAMRAAVAEALSPST